MKRAPVLGGSFALWGGTFSAVDCCLIALRKREDAINPIISGFITGGVLAFRGGVIAMIKNAFIGGAILGVMEMSSLLIFTIQMRKQLRMIEEQQREKYSKIEQQQASSYTTRHRGR